MGKTLFITGTGTEAGKTVVTGALLRALRQQGIEAVSMKPVQTGALETPEGLRAQDLDVHRLAAELPPATETDLERMAPYRYRPACSPHLAGRLAGAYPNIPHIAACAKKLQSAHDLLLVEGAGGLLVPLDETRTTLDLIQALACPVLVVAHIALGAINHTLLTLAALRAAGVPCAGVIFNEPAPGGEAFIKADNPGTVARFGEVTILGNITHAPEFREGDPAHWDRVVAQINGIHVLKQSLVG